VNGYITLPQYIEKWGLTRSAAMKLISTGQIEYVKPEGSRLYYIKDEMKNSEVTREDFEKLLAITTKIAERFGIEVQ
jgi:hypothetical protein